MVFVAENSGVITSQQRHGSARCEEGSGRAPATRDSLESHERCMAFHERLIQGMRMGYEHMITYGPYMNDISMGFDNLEMDIMDIMDRSWIFPASSHHPKPISSG